ncbi:Dynamitin-domain-containing protein [Lipomyces japonicus]|uniref:Dynamitin-domain-containing protein n=1 Tax=Lipomyces japonicus TaxID=56871 RepID=UPI0034CEFDD8
MMPILEKYNLPGLDTSSPDVFETPDVNPEQTLEPAIVEVENENIDSSTISPDEARERFLNKTLRSPLEHDGANARFESTDAKIARLRAEIDELNASIKDDRVSELSDELNGISSLRLGRISEVVKMLLSNSTGTGSDQPREKIDMNQSQSSIPLEEIEKYKLSAACIDERLALLEKALGAPESIAYSKAFRTSSVYEQPVIPTLLSLAAKINSIDSDSIAAITDRISSTQLPSKNVKVTEDEKIGKLYAVLGDVENLAITVPSLIDRLKSLRYVHAEAGEVVSNIADLRDRVSTAEVQVQRWTSALEGAETRLQDIEKREKENLEKADAWVRELEKRVENLSN